MTPEPPLSGGEKPISETAIVHLSGDYITDRLQIAIFHSIGDIGIDMSCRLASSLADLLGNEYAIEDWGIRIIGPQDLEDRP